MIGGFISHTLHTLEALKKAPHNNGCTSKILYFNIAYFYFHIS